MLGQRTLLDKDLSREKLIQGVVSVSHSSLSSRVLCPSIQNCHLLLFLLRFSFVVFSLGSLSYSYSSSSSSISSFSLSVSPSSIKSPSLPILQRAFPSFLLPLQTSLSRIVICVCHYQVKVLALLPSQRSRPSGRSGSTILDW